MPEISVIVPIYNAVANLDRCVKSILSQSYTDIEIVLVDDGCDDGSNDICDKYARLDRRVRVLHQDNNGVSAARNKGLDIAIGKYISFVDADDWLEPDMLAVTRYYMLVNPKVDICGVNCYVHNTNGNFRQMFSDEKPIYIDENIGYDMLFNASHKEQWGKLYRRKTFMGIRYDETLRVGEPLVANVEIIKRRPIICFLPYKGYHYSISYNSLSKHATERYVGDYIKALMTVWDSFIHENKFRSILENIFVNLLTSITMRLIIENQKNNFKNIERCITFFHTQKENIQMLNLSHKQKEICSRLAEGDIEKISRQINCWYDNYQERMLLFATKFKSIYIYGCGHLGQKIGKFLSKQRIPFSFVVSSSSPPFVIDIDGKKRQCESIDDLSENRDDTGIIMAMTEKSLLEVQPVLNRLGYKNLFNGNELGLHQP